MAIFSAAEGTANYVNTGVTKSKLSVAKMLGLGFSAGFIIAMGAAASTTAALGASSVGAGRLISGLVFAFGLGLVVITGSELFTGNNLMIISLLDKKISLGAMLRNWIFVYIGNFIGSIFAAIGCALFGQLNQGAGQAAVSAIKIAVGKCTLPFGNAIWLGIFCNLLVCIAVFVSLCGQDGISRIVGAYVPVALFVIAGFEHSIANMYYVSVGLLAKGVPHYAELALAANVNLDALTWGRFFYANLLPVTIGNIIGGAGFGALMWCCWKKGKEK
jgi:formate/nitrite transporter